MLRASQGEKADNTFDSQVLQYEPAHQGSINTITNLSPDLCVSGGSDQVNLCICTVGDYFKLVFTVSEHAVNIACLSVCVCASLPL